MLENVRTASDGIPDMDHVPSSAVTVPVVVRFDEDPDSDQREVAAVCDRPFHVDVLSLGG